MIWFPIVIGMAFLYVVSVNYVAIALGFAVPEMTLSLSGMAIEVLKNLFEEGGILGGVLGWMGFLMSYFQKKFRSNVKSGLLIGLIFGIYVLPVYVISFFELAATFTDCIFSNICWCCTFLC